MAAADSAFRRSSGMLGVVVCLSLAAPPPTTAAEGLAIVGATVFDGTGSPARVDAVVVVEREKIRSVGPRSHTALPKGVPYVDGRGLFVVPGCLRDPKIAADLRHPIQGGKAFERALADVLRAETPAPCATIEPGRPADLALLDKDPRLNLDHLGSVKRAFVAGREVAP
jgi:predicted amidohydrolase YtcJ